MPTLPPNSVIILIVVFTWGFLKNLGTLGRENVDRMLLKQISLGWLQPIFLWCSLVLGVLSIWYLLRPAPMTTTVCLTSIGLSAAIMFIFWVLSFSFNEVYRQAGVISRESRGLPPMSDKALEFGSNRIVITVIYAFMLFLHWLLVSVVLSNQAYFESFAR
jgi:hypothetical protein